MRIPFVALVALLSFLSSAAISKIAQLLFRGRRE
jgi:hypothetical protein